MRQWINLVENAQHIYDVIEQEISKTGYDDPREINDGWCYFFADKVVEALGGPTQDIFAADTADELDLERVGQTYDPIAPNHAFIVYHGRVYDSEAPEGRDRWQDLPYFRRHEW